MVIHSALFAPSSQTQESLLYISSHHLFSSPVLKIICTLGTHVCFSNLLQPFQAVNLL